MSMFKPALVAAALAVAAVSAQAGPTWGLGSLSASFIDLSVPGVVTGGALYAQNVTHAEMVVPLTTNPDSGRYAAQPWDGLPAVQTTVGTWLAAGPSNGAGDDAVLHLGAGTTGVSFLWGSPDDYNSFSVTTSSGTFGFAPGVFGITLNQAQNKAYYVNFTTSGSETISSLTFKSPGTNAIEIANVAVVPEPEAYGLALAGLSIVGFAMALRRKG